VPNPLEILKEDSGEWLMGMYNKVKALHNWDHFRSFNDNLFSA
jgi:hypothetical protein